MNGVLKKAALSSLTVLALITVLIMVSCDGNGTPVTTTGTGGGTQALTEAGTTAAQTEDKTEKMVVIAENGQARFNLIYRGSDPAGLKEVSAFAESLGQKTGAVFELLTEAPASPGTEHSIYIGRADVASEKRFYDSLTYSGYKAVQSDGDIYFCCYEQAALKKMLPAFLEAVIAAPDGGWGIPEAYGGSGSLSSLSAQVPFCPGIYPDSVISCGEGNRMATFDNFSDKSYGDYLNILKSSGYALSYSGEISGNLFSVYTNGTCQLVLYRYPSKGIFKLIYGAPSYLPETVKPQITKVCAPGITQPGRLAADESAPDGAPGMSYIIQLSDGRYIIIDGGAPDSEDRDMVSLYSFLSEHKPENQSKPVIAAWFITHAHSDHIALATRFIKAYANDVVFEMFAYNFPDISAITMTENAVPLENNVNSFKSIVMNFAPKAKKLILHTGQRFWLGDAEICILYTPENHAPSVFPTGNHTSIAFSVEIGSTKFMVLGDCEKSICRFMAEAYGDALKSDICQMTHHGVNGAVIELYRLIDPEICFWAIDEGRFQSHTQIRGDKAWDYNKWILDDTIRKRTHYSTSKTATIYVS